MTMCYLSGIDRIDIGCRCRIGLTSGRMTYAGRNGDSRSTLNWCDTLRLGTDMGKFSSMWVLLVSYCTGVEDVY